MKGQHIVNAKKKILFLDIETAPNLGYTWGKWEQNVIEFKDDWHMLSFSVKWLDEAKTEVFGLPDFAGYAKDKKNDKKLCQKMWEYFDKAEVIVAHNGNSFDIKKANARFLIHGLKPPTPYKTIDTKLVAKRYFKFDSNSLNDLARQLGLGKKMDTGGFELWLGCMAGDMKAWAKMLKYNKQDVVLLEKVYLKLRDWMVNHPNTNLMYGTTNHCPNCNSSHMQRRGLTMTRTTLQQRYQCQDCGSWSHGVSERQPNKVR